MNVIPIGLGLYRVSDDERSWTVAVAGPPENRWVWIDGHVAQPEVRRRDVRTRGRASHLDLTSPMPATVVRTPVTVGDAVARGDTLVILEAMKMELPIRAPRDGVVKAVHCQPGELVQPGVPLIDLE